MKWRQTVVQKKYLKRLQRKSFLKWWNLLTLRSKCRKLPSWISIPRYIIVKLLKTKEKNKILKASVTQGEMHYMKRNIYKSGKWWLNSHHKGILGDSETVSLKGWNGGRGVNQLGIQYSGKLAFRNEGVIKYF